MLEHLQNRFANPQALIRLTLRQFLAVRERMRHAVLGLVTTDVHRHQGPQHGVSPAHGHLGESLHGVQVQEALVVLDGMEEEVKNFRDQGMV